MGYLLVRCLLGGLMVLARREVSKEAELLVSGMRTRCCAARPAGSATSRATGCGWRRYPVGLEYTIVKVTCMALLRCATGYA